MNNRMKKQMQKLSTETGLKLDEKTGMLYGNYRGHNMCIRHTADNSNLKSAMVAVSQNGSPLSSEEIERFVSDRKDVIKSYQNMGARIVFELAHGISMKKDLEKNKKAVEAIATFLNAAGYADSCEICGQNESMETYVVNGTGFILCQNCMQTMMEQSEQRRNEFQQKKGSAFLGMVGALLGSLLGVLAIVVISQLGYVAAISGIIMGVCTMYGYEKFSKKLDKKGIIISSVIMLGMVYFANNLDWAVSVIRYFDDVNIFDAYQAIPQLLQNEMIEKTAYYGNMALIYVFVLVGAVPVCTNAYKEQKNQFELRRAA